MASIQDFVYNYRGRRELYTDEPEITSENVIRVLQEAVIPFSENVSEIQFLLDYDAGIQPLRRNGKKKYRPDIDHTVIDNIANEVVEFNLGFKWGYPITLIQRGEQDSGADRDEIDGISLLNEGYYAEGINTKTQKLGRFVEICGVGYTYIDINTDYEEGDSYFRIEALDPRWTFVVRSSRYIDRRVMMGVTFRADYYGNLHYTCFTKDRRYEIVNLQKIENGNTTERWYAGERSGEINPLGMVPIIEWTRSWDRQGCFERCISEMDSLNLLTSDLANSVDQNTDCFWHTNDVDFPVEEVTDSDGNVTTQRVQPESGDWLQTYTAPDGRTPFIKPLVLDYDYNGILENIVTKRTLILQKCNVPQRNDNNGGSTGVAMDAATGWSAAETAASKQQNIMESCKMEEVKVVLRAIAKNPKIKPDNPMLKLRYSDMMPSVKRQKSYEMVGKANAFATYVAHGVHPLHALNLINAFDDNNQVYADSKETFDLYQKSIFEPKRTVDINEDRIDQDLSDQDNNSPFIGGPHITNGKGDDA